MSNLLGVIILRQVHIPNRTKPLKRNSKIIWPATVKRTKVKPMPCKVKYSSSYKKATHCNGKPVYMSQFIYLQLNGMLRTRRLPELCSLRPPYPLLGGLLPLSPYPLLGGLRYGGLYLLIVLPVNTYKHITF